VTRSCIEEGESRKGKETGEEDIRGGENMYPTFTV